MIVYYYEIILELTTFESLCSDGEIHKVLDNYKPHPLMAVIRRNDVDALWARVSSLWGRK
jgi:hypothetical protein